MIRILLFVSLALIALAQAPTEAPPVPQQAPPTPPPERCRQLIDAALSDKNPDTRLQAVVALSLSTAKQPWTGMVANMLDDKDVQVRVAAVATLMDLRGPDTRTILHKALNDEVPEVSFAATRALYELGDPAGKQGLLVSEWAPALHRCPALEWASRRRRGCSPIPLCPDAPARRYFSAIRRMRRPCRR